jgi:hypothetical protein
MNHKEVSTIANLQAVFILSINDHIVVLCTEAGNCTPETQVNEFMKNYFTLTNLQKRTRNKQLQCSLFLKVLSGLVVLFSWYLFL